MKKLIYLRNLAGLSQKALAQKLGVHQQTISNIENGLAKSDFYCGYKMRRLLMQEFSQLTPRDFMKKWDK